MVSFYFSCFLCDRSSRWDSELCAQLPWKPNPRGDWAPVGGRSRRTKRRGSCQGRPDSSGYIGLQRPDVHFGHNTGRDWGKFLPAVNAELDRNEIYITAGIFLDADGFVQVHFLVKSMEVQGEGSVPVYTRRVKSLNLEPSFGLVPSLAKGLVLTHRYHISIQRTYFFLFWCSSPVCS